MRRLVAPERLRCLAAVFLEQVVLDCWSGCKIRTQTGVGRGDNCDVGYTGIDSQRCRIRGVITEVIP